MVQLSRAEFNAIAKDQRRKAAERKAKRQEKGAVLFPKIEEAKTQAQLRQEAIAKKEERKARAKANSGFIAKISGSPVRLIKRGNLKEQLVTMLGLQDRLKNGKACRIHGDPCIGTLGYHLVPQQRGDATRLLPCNVVNACVPANRGEQMNRSLYRQKHVDIFGAERIERLEEFAGQQADISTAQLLDIRVALKQAIETRNYLSDLDVTRILGLPDFVLSENNS